MTVSLDISTDRSLIRAGARSTRFVLARVTAPAAPQRPDRVPVNVAFVLDRSGSMGDARKFELAERIMEYAFGDADLLHTASALRNDVERYAERQMSLMELKQSFAAADYMVRDRAPSGRARKKLM